MPHLKVQSEAKSPASADKVWAVARDFCAPWHPAVAVMEPEPTGSGGLIRRFQVAGETTTYRERLTYFSDSDRVMTYTHVEGIDGVHTYDATLTVTPTGDGSIITISAELSAPAPRAQDIAAGTQAVFDAGTVALASLGSPNAPQKTAHETQVPQRAITPEREHTRTESEPRLAFTVGGADRDVLCLFLHGIGGGRSNWDRQLEALAPHTRVAALDLRGYGDSALGAGQSTIDDYCADIQRVLAVTGARKLILCGLSYGAWIATSFAMRHPDQLAALVLSGGCTGMSEAGAAERDAFRRSRETPLNEGQTPADFAPSVIDVIAGPEATADIRATLQASMSAIPATTYGDALRCFTSPPEQFDFSKLDLPVLLMTGQHDRLAPPTEIRGVAERILASARHADVRFEVITGAGHVCNVEKPDAYNAILTEFITRVLP